jgi:hypothetical protein
MSDIETPQPDAAEQEQLAVEPDEGVDEAPAPAADVLEADEADVAESRREVPLDEDDYR